jgi:hypothetical protein
MERAGKKACPKRPNEKGPFIGFGWVLRPSADKQARQKK